MLFYVFAGYLPHNSVNCGVNATSCNVLFVIDLSMNMVNFYGKQYIVLSPTEIFSIEVNGFKSSSFIFSLIKALIVNANIVHIGI